MLSGRKQSFLEHLTGSRKIEDEESEVDQRNVARDDRHDMRSRSEYIEHDADEEDADDELAPDDDEDEVPGIAVDMYESDNEILVQCMIAGVTPENLHISITRNTVTIEGRRNAPEVPDEQYVSRELYWGPFLREVDLPHEVDPTAAEAVEKYGLLSIRLPKLDTALIQELKVKSAE